MFPISEEVRPSPLVLPTLLLLSSLALLTLGSYFAFPFRITKLIVFFNSVRGETPQAEFGFGMSHGVKRGCKHSNENSLQVSKVEDIFCELSCFRNRPKRSMRQ